MNRKAQLGPDTSSIMRAKPAVVKDAPRSLVNTNGDSLILLPLQLAQGPQFIAHNRMGGRGALLEPPDVQDGVGEIDLNPTQVYKLGCRRRERHAMVRAQHKSPRHPVIESGRRDERHIAAHNAGGFGHFGLLAGQHLVQQ